MECAHGLKLSGPQPRIAHSIDVLMLHRALPLLSRTNDLTHPYRSVLMRDPEIPLGGCLPSQCYEEMAYDPREGGKDLARDDHALLMRSPTNLLQNLRLDALIGVASQSAHIINS